MPKEMHRYNTRSKNNKPSNDDDPSDEEEILSGSDSEEETFDIQEYRKLLANIFPSKYSRQRATTNTQGKKRKHISPTSSQEDVVVKSIKKNYTSLSDTEEEDDSDYEDTEYEETEEEEYETEEDDENPTSFTINFTCHTNLKKQDENVVLPNKSNPQIETNTQKFEALIRDKNLMTDTLYFKNELTTEQQEHILQDMEKVVNMYRVDKPYRIQLLDTDIPPEYKAIALKKINQLKFLEPGQGEFYKAKQWINTFMNIPFGKYKHLNVNLKQNTREECADFIHNAKTILDKAVYGMNDVKMQILQMVGMWITNPDAMGTSIAIKGPMGTGKTTLVKEGISKILGRDFAFMALGGATDSSFLEGHSYTYEGATWGKIIDSLIQCKSMNPVFFFDELDKVSETAKGEEIIGILTHLTDTTQNSKFHDKYFAELDFDLSKCLFIFSYNDESKVNPILLDRMYKVQTNGYTVNEKMVISNEYLLPKIRDQVCFAAEDVTIEPDVIQYIVNTHCDKEEGVRNIKRCFEIIYTKLNLYRLLKPEKKLFDTDKDAALNITFPLILTKELVDNIIRKKPVTTGNWSNMYL